MVQNKCNPEFKILYYYFSYSMIQYDSTTVYIIGGIQNYDVSEKTWIVNISDR